MSAAFLDAIAERVDDLTVGERLWLIERLARSLRRGTPAAPAGGGSELAAMAADPDIRRETAEIELDGSHPI